MAEIPANYILIGYQGREPVYGPRPKRAPGNTQSGGTASRADAPKPCHDSGGGRQSVATGIVERPKAAEAPKNSGIRKMNRTEAAFAALLEAEKRAGIIREWRFEAVTLRYGPRRFTPDFLVTHPDGGLTFRETKGPFIRPDAALKYDLFREAWPAFGWEMWQRSKEKTWTRIK